MKQEAFRNADTNVTQTITGYGKIHHVYRTQKQMSHVPVFLQMQFGTQLQA